MSVVVRCVFTRERSTSSTLFLMMIILLSLTTSTVSLSERIQSSCFQTPSCTNLSFIKSFHRSKSGRMIKSQRSNLLSFHRNQHPNRQGYISNKQSNSDEDIGNISFGTNRKQFIQTFLKIIGTGIVSTPFLGEIYSRIGKPHYSSILSNIFHSLSDVDGKSIINSDDIKEMWTNMEEITFVFHGAGGQDDNTDALMKTLSSSQSNNDNKGIVQMVEWSIDSQDLLQASVNGINIGKRIADSLADILLSGGSGSDDSSRLSSTLHLRSIHVIGISVGAFAAHSFIQEFNSKFKKGGTNQDLYVQGTFLDPLCSKGVLGFKYGENEFGKGCDYAQQFLNTDDPVPFTNSNVMNCATTDVTSLRPEEIFGHDWPLIYYTKNALPRSTRGFVSKEDQQQIGSILTL